jgi:hypothetical protein
MMWPIHVLIFVKFYRHFLLHNTPTTSCKINYKAYFTHLNLSTLKKLPVKNKEGMRHHMIWPKMSS